MTRYQENESILFHNTEETVFLIDIPHSIAEAQLLPPAQSLDQTSVSELEESHTSSKSKPKTQRLISTPPLENPYSSSTEPKTNAARGRILSRVSPGERRYHDEFIQPLVTAALNELQAAYKPSSPDTRWCFPRAIHDEGIQQSITDSTLAAAASTGKKRKSEHLQHGSVTEGSDRNEVNSEIPCSSDSPPIVLSSSSCNAFTLLTELAGGVVKNPSSEQSVISIRTENGSEHGGADSSTYMIPPQSTFSLCTLPLSDTEGMRPPIPGFPHNQQFNLIVFDPPWPNRSVKRSRKYQTHSYDEMELLTSWIQDVLTVHSHNSLFDSRAPNTTTNLSPEAHETQVPSHQSFAAIWITNSEKARGAAYHALSQNGFSIYEEWIWVKVTAEGEPVYPMDGVWRKPYEILVIGRANQGTAGANIGPMDSGSMSTDEVLENNIDLLGLDPGTVPRRVIAAVPDLHSRKPNLKSIFERFLFSSTADKVVSESSRQSYTALEVFARNLTAEWWACGNEVLKFNASDCWTEPDEDK